MGVYTWDVFPTSGSSNFESTARGRLETWRGNVSSMDDEIVAARNGKANLKAEMDAKAASSHTHGGDGVFLSMVANAAALGTGATDGELKVCLDTFMVYSWDDGNSIWQVAGHYLAALNGLEAVWYSSTGDIVETTKTQTLTNKRLTSPKINEDVVLTGTATELNDAVAKKHARNTDTGTTATSFKINSGGNEGDLQTDRLSGDRDFTLPDGDGMVVIGELTANNGVECIAHS